MNSEKALYNFCLRLADNNLIAGQRLAEWCSRGPILKEDLALTNLALDYLGQAEAFYEYAAELGGHKHTADTLAFRRSEREYFNALIVEQPCGDFAFSMMKELLFSAFSKQFYEALISSKDPTLSNLSARGLKELKYHFRHSSEWIIRLGNGTEESRTRTQVALDQLWMFTVDMFEMNQTDKLLIESGISVYLTELFPAWKAGVEEVLRTAHLRIPENQHMIKGGYNGTHTECLGHLLCEMQFLQRAYPDAVWN